MAGMGDPYGLVEDESDFLLHPSQIVSGEGIRYYANYRFNYTNVLDWNYTLNRFDSATGLLIGRWPYRGGGNEQEHDVLLGVSFPFGRGRMGLFSEYAGKRKEFEGHEESFYSPAIPSSLFFRYGLENDLDAFSVRLLLGLPVSGVNFGTEVHLGYRHEQSETFAEYSVNDLSVSGVNTLSGAAAPWWNFFPFLYPHDSKYWESHMKLSADTAIDSLKVAFSVSGGYIFSAENELKYKEIVSDLTLPSTILILDGDIEGWKATGDLWLRYLLTNNISLPFSVKVEYSKRTLMGRKAATVPGMNLMLLQEQRNAFHINVGGGADKDLGKGTRLAGGDLLRLPPE
jgi:hypothetical protein